MPRSKPLSLSLTHTAYLQRREHVVQKRRGDAEVDVGAVALRLQELHIIEPLERAHLQQFVVPTFSALISNDH